MVASGGGYRDRGSPSAVFSRTLSAKRHGEVSFKVSKFGGFGENIAEKLFKFNTLYARWARFPPAPPGRNIKAASDIQLAAFFFFS